MTKASTNSIDTFYEDVGLGQAVVLIHGHSIDLRLWDYQMPALLAAGFRVIRYDVRGHGHSDAPPSGYTWQDYAADLGALLNHLEVERSHLVGLSMGGGIALQFALEFPPRVLSLVLIDSSLPGFTYSPQFSAQIEELAAAVRREGPRPALERLWLPHPFFDGVRRFPERFAFLRDIVLSYPAADYLEGAIPVDYEPQVASRLSEIQAPAVVIVGERDIDDFRLIADALAENLPNARKLVLPDCGHVPPLEAPEALNAALIEFLQDASGAQTT